MVACDQFLRQPFADFWIGGVVAAQQLDLDAGRQLLFVLLDVEIDAFLGFVGRLGDKAGIAVDHPNLDGLRRQRCGRQRAGRQQRADELAEHLILPVPVPAHSTTSGRHSSARHRG